MLSRSLLTIFVCAAALFAMGCSGDAPTQSANANLGSSGNTPGVDSPTGTEAALGSSASTSPSIGSGAPMPGALPASGGSCSASDLGCICEAALTWLQECASTFGIDGDELSELDPSLCAQADAQQSLARDYCESSEQGQSVNVCELGAALVPCLTTCDVGQLESCLTGLNLDPEQFEDFIPREPREPNPIEQDFPCGDGSVIDLDEVCDGEIDCENGIDEAICDQ